MHTLRRSTAKGLSKSDKTKEDASTISEEQNLVLYKKLKESLNFIDIFSMLHQIIDNENNRRTRRLTVTKKSKPFTASPEFTAVYRFLKLIRLYKEQVTGSVGWSQIFRNFLLQFPEFSKLKSFNAQNVNRYINVLQYYLQCCKEVEGEKKQKYQSHVAECSSLVEFLEYHLEDPFSLLIGLQVSKEAAEEVRNFNPKIYNASQFTSEYLLHKFVQLSNIMETETAIKQLREFVGEVRCNSISSLLKGEMVIVNLENRLIYARFNHKMNEKSFYCFTRGDENKLSIFSIDCIYPIHKDSFIYKTIENYDFEENFYLGFEKLLHVENTETEKCKNYYIKSIQQLFQEKMEEYLCSTPNISTPIATIIFSHIRNKKSNSLLQFTFEDQKELEKIVEVLKNLLHAIPTEFLESIQAIIEEKLYEVRMQIKKNRQFRLNLYKTLKQLNKLSHENLVRGNINRIIEICESSLLQLKNQRHEIIDGSTKEKLVCWWLNQIESSVQSFLESKFVLILSSLSSSILIIIIITRCTSSLFI